MTWSRHTLWRQGLVLPPDVATALDLVAEEGEACVVVVSHDCDLAQDPSIEADVEVIVGKLVANANGNFTHAKNTRRLHLTMSGGTQTVVVELNSTGKRPVSKSKFGDEPSSLIRPALVELVILQRWLASRYRRSAFAEEFDRRLTSLGLRDRMAKALKKSGHFISAVYFDLDKGNQIERSLLDPYELSIYFLYDTAHDPVVAEEAASEVASTIIKAFRQKCCSDAGIWSHIELINCQAVSDQGMSVQQADGLARWSADYMSLRVDPPATMRQDD